MNLYFFNNFGNGDIFLNMPYIVDIANQLDNQITYLHKKSSRLLLDKNFKTGISPFNFHQIPNPYKIFTDNNNNIYFNTHIGAYFDTFHKEKDFNTNLPSFYKLFSFLYDEINRILNKKIIIKNIEYYFHDIDYNFYRTKPIDDFFKNIEYSKKILICNGPALSGQCYGYNGDMKNIVETIANKFPNYLFICASNFNTIIDNIKFTDDIIGHDLNNNNLNEVSYISTKCDIIAGKNSGPLCFCSTKKNMFDTSKKMIVFGNEGPLFITHNVQFDWNISYHIIHNEKDILELLLTHLQN